MRKILLVTSHLLFIFFASQNVLAQNLKIWTGYHNSGWNNKHNWDNTTTASPNCTTCSVPQDGDYVVIDPSNYAGSSSSPIVSANALNELGQAPDLVPTIPSGVGLYILNGGVLTVQGSLNSIDAADIRINNGQLILESGADVSGWDDIDVFNCGIVTIEAGASLNIADDIKFNNTCGSGGINMSGGTVVIGGTVNFRGSSGYSFDISGGDLTLEGFVATTTTAPITDIGDGSNIVTNITGGTITTTVDLSSGIDTHIQVVNLNEDGNIYIQSGGELEIINMGTVSVPGNITIDAGGLFTPNTGTVELNGTSQQTITDSNGTPNAMYNLTINNSADDDAVVLASDLDVTNTLTLTDGIVATGSNTLSMSNCSSVALSGGSSDSFINGTLERCTNSTNEYEFPVGAGTDYKLAALQPNATTPSTYDITAYAGGHNATTINSGTLTNVSAVEYWDINRSAGADVFIKLYWQSRAESGISGTNAFSDLRMGHFDVGGTDQWESVSAGNSGATDPGYIVSSLAIGSFSPFTFASNSTDDNPLPVTWLSVSAQLSVEAAEIYWSTASETNNEGFYVEGSRDGKVWTELGYVAGKGTTYSVQEYSFIHRTPTKYYRIKQVDFDGAWEYSSIVALSDDSRTSITLVNSPKAVGLNIKSTSYQSITLILFDISGRLMDQHTVSITPGLSFVPLSRASSGLQIVHVLIGSDCTIFRY